MVWMKAYMGDRDERGLTLVELLIAVAIIGILSAIMIPGYINGQPMRKLRSASRDVFSTFHQARSEAAGKYRAHRVFFDIGNRRFRLERAEADCIQSCSCTTWSPVLETSHELPGGVSFESVNGATSGTASHAYNVNGTSQDLTASCPNGNAASVILANSRGERYQVTVSPMGNIRMQKL